MVPLSAAMDTRTDRDGMEWMDGYGLDMGREGMRKDWDMDVRGRKMEMVLYNTV